MAGTLLGGDGHAVGIAACGRATPAWSDGNPEGASVTDIKSDPAARLGSHAQENLATINKDHLGV
jgi:hypothetical protein